jgi:hypothetical protein
METGGWSELELGRGAGGDGLTCLNTTKQTDRTIYVRQCDGLNQYLSLHLLVSATIPNMHEEVN